MIAYFYLSSPVGPLFADFLFSFIAGALLLRLLWRLLTAIALPLSIAFICASPRDLLFGHGEAAGWSVIILIYLSAWGLLASAVGVVLGRSSRHWLFSLP